MLVISHQEILYHPAADYVPMTTWPMFPNVLYQSTPFVQYFIIGPSRSILNSFIPNTNHSNFSEHISEHYSVI